jgi:hypothetical protein
LTKRHKDKVGDVYTVNFDYVFYDPITNRSNVYLKSGDILVLIETVMPSFRDETWGLTTFLTSKGTLVQIGHTKGRSIGDSGWNRIIKRME